MSKRIPKDKPRDVKFAVWRWYPKCGWCFHWSFDSLAEAKQEIRTVGQYGRHYIVTRSVDVQVVRDCPKERP